MRKCMKLEPRVSPWAQWNIACGLKKLNRPIEALKVLERIPAGPLWQNIANDDWFKDPEQTPFMNEFVALTKTKSQIH